MQTVACPVHQSTSSQVPGQPGLYETPLQSIKHDHAIDSVGLNVCSVSLMI